MPLKREEKVEERDSATGKFKKGNKTGGRKKLDPVIQKMLKAACPDMAQLLIDTANDKTVRIDVRVDCARTIIERVYGKPKQAVDIDAANIPQVVFVGYGDIAD